jgi:hypothetical protein
LDTITSVRVTDDGHGITSSEVGATFGRIGGSWKKLSTKSKNGLRILHGKLGEGRLRAFALGSRVTWASVSDNSVGEREHVTIEGSRRRRDHFLWMVQPSSASATGTVVTADNQAQFSLAALDAAGVLEALLAHFAPILLNDKSLTVVFDGAQFDPSQAMCHDTSIEIVFGERSEHKATVRIIEWKSGKHWMIYFGTDADHFQQ